MVTEHTRAEDAFRCDPSDAQEKLSPDVLHYDSLHVEIGEGRCFVELLILITRDGLIGFVSDECRSHVGATVISFPRPSLAKNGAQGCDSYVIPRPSHKDHVVAQEMSEVLSRSLGVPVVVIAGIHIDDAQDKEIECIRANCGKLVSQAVCALKGEEADRGGETS
jgi:gallate decarboxylase subunit D